MESDKCIGLDLCTYITIKSMRHLRLQSRRHKIRQTRNKHDYKHSNYWKTIKRPTCRRSCFHCQFKVYLGLVLKLFSQSHHAVADNFVLQTLESGKVKYGLYTEPKWRPMYNCGLDFHLLTRLMRKERQNFVRNMYMYKQECLSD